MKKLLLIFAAALALGCARERRVVIVSTNDIHSSIDNFPRLATLVDSLRTVYGKENVLLVDGGDRWSGDPFVDIATPPLYPVVELMNELGYDLGVLGNHEFDFGQDILRERVGQMDFPVITANVEGLDFIEPYKIVTAGGMRVAFFGLVTNFNRSHRPEGKDEHFVGLTFPNVFDTAEKYASLDDSADVFVALTHIGHRADLALADSLPSLDLIIGGDSHTVVDHPEYVGRTLITQTGSKLEYAGVTTINVMGGEYNGMSIENHLVPLAAIAPDPRVAEIVARVKNNPELLAPLGETAAPFNSKGVDNLTTDAIRAYTSADAVFYHSGGIRLDTLSGSVSTADVYRIDPFLSEIYTLEMTAGEIAGMILGTFNSGDARMAGRADLLPAGVTYIIETDEAGRAVNVVLSPSKSVYTVAVPDYLYKNYPLRHDGDVTETGVQVTEMLLKYVSVHTPISPDNFVRVKIK